MSERNRTPEEYIELFARDRCNGNTEEAAGHAIVQAVCETLEKE